MRFRIWLATAFFLAVSFAQQNRTSLSPISDSPAGLNHYTTLPGGTQNDPTNIYRVSVKFKPITMNPEQSQHRYEQEVIGAGGTIVNSRLASRMVTTYITKQGLDRLTNSSLVQKIEQDALRQLVRPAIQTGHSHATQKDVQELLKRTQQIPWGIAAIQGGKIDDRHAHKVTICIVDTGYDLGHPDLPNGVSFSTISDTGDAFNDTVGHGTHLAGTISGINNGIGVVGILPSDHIKLHIVKVFGDNGEFSYASSLVDAIDRCVVDGHADVVNLSLGGPLYSQTEEEAFREFAKQGLLVVAAAGNDGDAECAYPACYDHVLSVAAIDYDFNNTSFSNRNFNVDLCAPGFEVASTFPRHAGSYAILSGTSMAAPHVTAAAALVWSFHRQCTAAEIRTALENTANDLSHHGRDDTFGHGLVQAKAAKEYLDKVGCAAEAAHSNNNGVDTTTIPPCSSASTLACAPSPQYCCSDICHLPDEERAYYNTYYCKN
jgi:subtilisin family serine protease